MEPGTFALCAYLGLAFRAHLYTDGGREESQGWTRRSFVAGSGGGASPPPCIVTLTSDRSASARNTNSCQGVNDKRALVIGPAGVLA